MDKHELRKQLKAKRSALTKEQQQSSSALICEHILASEYYRKAKTILGYLAFGKELNLDAVLVKAIQDRKQVYVPFIVSETEFQAVRLFSLEDLVLDRYGIRTLNMPEEIIDPSSLDLVLVPAVAFAKDGSRLGMGAGYYDRFLLRCEQAEKLGIAYESLLQEQLPSDEYDIPIERLVTESGIINTTI